MIEILEQNILQNPLDPRMDANLACFGFFPIKNSSSCFHRCAYATNPY